MSDVRLSSGLLSPPSALLSPSPSKKTRFLTFIKHLLYLHALYHSSLGPSDFSPAQTGSNGREDSHSVQRLKLPKAQSYLGADGALRSALPPPRLGPFPLGPQTAHPLAFVGEARGSPPPKGGCLAMGTWVSLLTGMGLP